MICVSASYKDVAPTELLRFSVATPATFMRSLRDKWHGGEDEGTFGFVSVPAGQCLDELVPTDTPQAHFRGRGRRRGRGRTELRSRFAQYCPNIGNHPRNLGKLFIAVQEL